MNFGIEQSELFSQLFENLQNNEKFLSNLRPELHFILENYLTSQNPQAIASLFLILTEQDALETPYFTLVMNSNLYQCFHLIHTHIPMNDQILTILLEHSNLDELCDFLQCPQLPFILGQPNANLVILKILKDHKISQHRELIEFLGTHELLTSQILLSLFSIHHSLLFLNFLKNLDKLKILNLKNLEELLKIEQLSPFIDAFQHIPLAITEKNPQLILQLLSQLNSVNFIFSLDFTQPVELELFLEIFAKDYQSRLSILSNTGLINAGNRLPPNLLLSLLKLPESHFSLLISMPFAKKLISPSFIEFLMTKNPTLEKFQEILLIINNLQSTKIFSDAKTYTYLAEVVFNYKKNLPLDIIINSIIEHHPSITLSEFSKVYAYYENKYVIFHILKKITPEEIVSFPENLKAPMQAFIQGPIALLEPLFNLVQQIIHTPREILPPRLEQILAANFMRGMTLLKDARFFNAELLAIFFSKNKNHIPLNAITLFIKKIEELENTTSEQSFKNEYSLLQSPMLPAVLNKASEFNKPQNVLNIFTSLYFLKIFHSGNSESIFSIFDSMKKSLSLQELKIEFFIKFTQAQGGIQTRDFVFLIHQKMHYLVLFSQNKILNHLSSQSFLNLFHRHLQPKLMAEILLNIPEKCIFEQTNFSILDKIIQHTSPAHLNQFMESLGKSEQLIDSKLLQSILDYSSPKILMDTLPDIPKDSPDFLHRLNLNSRLKSLVMLKDVSEEAANYLERHDLLQAHHLYPFLERLVSLNPEYLDAGLKTHLQKLHFMGWLRLCFQHDLVNFSNIYQIIGQAFPQKSYETLRYLLTSPNFKSLKHQLFSAVLQNEETEYLCEIVKLLDDKKLKLTPESFKDLCQKKELSIVFASFNILLSEELYNPSIRYVHLLEQMIASDNNQNVLSIIINLRHFPIQKNLERFINCIFTHPESRMIADLSNNSILTRLFIHHRHIILFHELIASPIFLEIADSLTLFEHKKLFTNIKITRIDDFIKSLLTHPKNIILLKLIPKVIEIGGTEDEMSENLLKLLDCNLDWIDEFVSRYDRLTQILLNQFSSSLFDYTDIKVKLEKSISTGLIHEDDRDTQIKFFEISHRLNIFSFLEDVDKYHIVSPELRPAFIHQIIHHPKAKEMSNLFTFLEGFKIDLSCHQFKNDFIDIIKSPSPFDSCYLYGLAHQAQFLQFFDRVELKHLMHNHPSLWELSSKISTHIDIFTSLVPTLALELFQQIAHSSKSKELFDIYNFMILNTDVDPTQLIVLIKKARVHRSINEILPIMKKLNPEGLLTYEICNHLLKIKNLDYTRFLLNLLKSRNLLTASNIQLYFSHPDTINLAYFVNILNAYDLVNALTISTVLTEKNPIHACIFLDIAKKTRILSREFLIEFLIEKDSLFENEAVRLKFSQINPDYFTAINLQQLIQLSKNLRHNPAKLASEVLRTCNQLLQHHSSSQSTHLATVHESASLSAKKLLERYGHIELNFKELFNFLTGEIRKLENNFENQAALRCIKLLSNPYYTQSSDQVSCVNIQQLLGLCIVAIQDNSITESTFQTRVEALTKGLFDIIRGNTVDKYSPEEQDSPICDGGIFNKLIESLSSIHPDCKQVAITLNAASLKLPRLIIHCIKEFLIGFNPHSQDKLLLIQSLLDDLIDGDITRIWPSIGNQISDIFFEEFRILFTDNRDPKFLALIECGQQYTDLDELKGFAQELKKSKSRQFHFEQEGLFARRHENAQTQHAFDKVYGLISRNPS